MAQIPNPLNRKIVQLNNSDILGDLWASFNIDLAENEGTFRLGKRLVLNTNTSDTAEITSYPAAILIYGTTKYFVAGASGTGYVFSNGTAYPSATTFSKVAAAGSPSTCDSTKSDMIVSNGSIYVTTASNSVYKFDGSSWTTFTAGGSDAASVHMMTSYGGRTYMTRVQSSIISWDSADTVVTSGQYTLQLGNSDANNITFIRPSASRIWIGVVNKTGGKGYIYEWDGSSTQVTKSYRLEAAGALSCVIKDDIPYVIDTNGDLLVWNAGNFQRVGGVNRRRNKLLQNPLSQTNNRFIHPNGMSIVKGKINALLNGINYDNTITSASIEETIPSGVYEYDLNKGFYHKHSFGLSRAAGTITDYGQARIVAPGAIAEINFPDTSSSRNGTFMAGATYYTTASATTSGIFFDDSNDTEQKGGYFITTKMLPEPSKLGQVIAAIWKKIFIAYRKFLSSGDRMVVKVRFTEQEPTQMDISWTSTTTFTTTDSNMANYAVGDEVEIVQGIGGGICSHITIISLNAGTYTVTVDETHTSASGTAKARFQKWVKLKEINDQTSTYLESGLGDANYAATWVQFKVWMVFTGRDEIQRILVVDTPSLIAQ